MDPDNPTVKVVDPGERTYTCNDCGTTGSLQWMQDHPCGDVQDVRQFGGRCEDYPCCGHLNGECEPREEFTKNYWSRVYAENPEALYETGNEPS